MYWTVHLRGGPRFLCTAAVVVGSTIFTFGYDINMKFVARPLDIYIFDTEKLTWRKVDSTFDESCEPFQLYGHTAIAYGTKIYLWGGNNERNLCNSLYCFDTETFIWSKPLVSGIIPPAKMDHSACIVGHSIYLYGGNHRGLRHQFSTVLHKLDLNTMHWSIIETEGTPPPNRVFHSATAIGERIYIYGGLDTDRKCCEKVYYFDTTTSRWICPSVFGSIPMGQRNTAAFEYKGKLFIFGGHNTVLIYDPESSTWKTIIPKGTSPCYRRQQICLVVKNRVFITGGFIQHTRPSNARDIITLTLKKVDDVLHVLDLSPNLKDLCLVNIWDYVQKKQIDIQNISLPLTLKNDLQATKPFDDE